MPLLSGLGQSRLKAVFLKIGTLIVTATKKIKMKLLKVALYLIPFVLFSQSKEGYWDNVRTTNQTFTLKTNERKVVMSEALPVGTTEVVFRITVLDDNQQLSGSLVSILKAIPDPTGISQGSAGALFLVSKIAGDDKCKFAVFNSQLEAEAFQKSGKSSKSIYLQDVPVNKEAKLLKGFTSQNSRLWFVFESDNWFMKQKVVLEIVPWVDNKLNRGWNSETKKEIISLLEKQKVTASLKKKDEYFALFLDAITQKYTYTEYKQLLQLEKNNVLETISEESLKKSGEVEKYYNTIRDNSYQLFEQGKINEAIDVINSEMIAKKRANYKDYGVIGDYYLLAKQFTKAEEAYQMGLKLNASEIMFKLKLAHVYLFTDRASEAKEIYKKYINQTLFTGKTWKEQAESDFAEFEKRNFPKQNYKKILRIMD